MRSGTWVSTVAAQLAQQRDHQRRAARAIHVVVAEHADRLAALHGARRADRRPHPCRSAADGSGSSARKVGSRKSARGLDVDAARRQQAADDLRHAHALGDAEADTVLAAPPHPAPPAQAAPTPSMPGRCADGPMPSVHSVTATLRPRPLRPRPGLGARSYGAPRRSARCRTCCASPSNASIAPWPNRARRAASARR